MNTLVVALPFPVPGERDGGLGQQWFLLGGEPREIRAAVAPAPQVGSSGKRRNGGAFELEGGDPAAELVANSRSHGHPDTVSDLLK